MLAKESKTIPAAQAECCEPPQCKQPKLDPFSWFASGSSFVREDNRTASSRLEEELKMYKVEESVPCRAGFNPLTWWQIKADQYSCLSSIAKQVFVIPASSAESERHYSAFKARNIITAQRNAMYPETVEAISVVLEGYKNKLII